MATADVSYVPGALTAVTGGQCWALVEISPDSPAVTRIWQQLGQGAAPDTLLAGLLANGLGGTPGFTVLVAEPGGQHRLFCRGAVGATVVTRSPDGGAPAGERQPVTSRFDGTGLLTWREQVVEGAERIFLGAPPAAAALRLPATSGVLLAGCVVIDLTSVAPREAVAYAPQDLYPPGKPKKAIVYFPDTITVTPAGRPAEYASVEPPTAEYASAGPVGLGDPYGAPAPAPVPVGPVPVGPVPVGPAPLGPASIAPLYQPSATRAESEPAESKATVKRRELSEPAAVTIPPDRIGPVVPALLCPSRHVNPPSGTACRRCGAPLPHDPVPVPRPVLGVLRLSLGDVIMLDRGVVMGRNPRTDYGGPDGFGGSAGEERPHVVKLPSADGDISRTHLRVTLDGWHVLVTDLNSTNGTLVTLPGHDPQQLRPGEPLPVQSGTVVTLADGIDFRYEAAD